MKHCPRCQMTVDAHSECPVCKADLTDVAYRERSGETYKLNRWFVGYFIRKNVFFLCCVALIVLKVICFGATINGYLLLTAVLLLWMVAESLFPERLKQLVDWRYTESFLELMSGRPTILACGVLALISTVLWW